MGDKNAFKIVFNDYYSILFHLSFQYINNEDDAKDIVQDSYLKLWEVKEKLDTISNIKNFLFTIAKNNCLNYIKRKQIITGHRDQLKYIEMQFNYEALYQTGEDFLAFDELKEDIEAAIDKLPEQCGQVFTLSRFNELRHKEIAKKLGIGTKAVEAHITKALKILQHELKNHLYILLLITSYFL